MVSGVPLVVPPPSAQQSDAVEQPALPSVRSEQHLPPAEHEPWVKLPEPRAQQEGPPGTSTDEQSDPVGRHPDPSARDASAPASVAAAESVQLRVGPTQLEFVVLVLMQVTRDAIPVQVLPVTPRH